MKYIIKSKDLEATILSLGATLQSLKRIKDNLELIVSFEEPYYKDNMEVHGAIVGPSAGRIFGKEFIIKGEKYVIKDFDKCLLHSGHERIYHEEFKLINHSKNSISFEYFYTSKKYKFLSDQKVIIEYKIVNRQLTCSITSKSEKFKIMNYTNHTYFTLGSKDSRKLLLKGDISKEFEMKDNILTGEIIPLKSFDFSSFNSFNIIDNPFILDGNIVLKNPENNISLIVKSNQPVVVIYNDAYSEMKTKFKGLAIEMQGYISAVNYKNFPQNISKEKNNTIKWSFEW